MIPKVDRSFFPGIRGFNSIVSLLVCSAFTLLALVNKNNAPLQPPTGTTSGIFFAGCLICVLLIRGGSLFTAVVQPPIIVTMCTGFYYWHTIKQSHDQKLITIGMSLAQFFPTLAITCLIVALIGLIRWLSYRRVDILATPTHTSSATATMRTSHHVSTPAKQSARRNPSTSSTTRSEITGHNPSTAHMKTRYEDPTTSSQARHRSTPQRDDRYNEASDTVDGSFENFSSQSYARYLAQNTDRKQRISSYHQNRQQRYSRLSEPTYRHDLDSGVNSMSRPIASRSAPYLDDDVPTDVPTRDPQYSEWTEQPASAYSTRDKKINSYYQHF